MALPSDLTFYVYNCDPSKPVVLLVHGGGSARTKQDMVAPTIDTPFNFNYSAPFQPDQDLGWSWYPGIGCWFSGLSPTKPVRSWQKTLQVDNQFRTVAYSQNPQTASIVDHAWELSEVVDAVRARYPAARLVLLTHSRGGLVVRKFLKDNAANPNRVGQIAAVITLVAPHQGSSLANAVASVIGSIDSWAGPNPLLYLVWFQFGLRAWVLKQLGERPDEMAVGGHFLTQLRVGETALPGVQYYTFGGTSMLFFQLLQWCYTWWSSIPQWHWPPFYHTITMSEVNYYLSPVASSAAWTGFLGGLGFPELVHGIGDLLTTDERCHLPFAEHRSKTLNHAEFLWDNDLQQEVLAILNAIG